MRLTVQWIVAAACGLMIADVATGGVIYLKDGFALHGTLRKEMEMVIDPATGQPIQMFKASPQFLLDDRARYMVLGPKQVESTDKDKDIRDGHGVFQSAFVRAGNKSRPAMAIIGDAGPFNEKWERSVAITVYDDMMKYARPGDPPINDPNLVGGRYRAVNAKIRQKITLLSPYFVRLECFEYDWSVNYLTAEFGPGIIIPLLRSHSEVKSKDGAADFDKQFRVFRFCVQAGWLDEAGQELARLRSEFPGMSDRLDESAKGLGILRSQRAWDEIDHAARAGRHAFVQKSLGTLRPTDLPAALQGDLATLRAKYELLAGKMSQIEAAFKNCYDDFVGPPSELVARAIPVIRKELNYDVIDRLEPMAALGRQWELDVQNGKQPQYTADQVLAAGITGWVLGPGAAEASEATAQQLWSVREQILDLQRTAAPIDRNRKLGEFVKSVKLTVDEVARLITLLPPPDGISSSSAEDAAPLELQTRSIFTQHPAVKFRLSLPPEYHPSRAYPLLVVVPNINESTDQAIRPWLADAAKYGFVVAAVDWAGANNRYQYLPEEHHAVLDCVSEVQRLVNVDSDRVFLSGNGEGGNAVYDIALSHPDVFAGAIPINGRPRWYINQWYWRNAQNLPFYMVIGELSGDIRPWVASLAEKWIEKGYQSLLVMYRGRPTEFFPAEIPSIFDWMSRKRRWIGFPDLGRSPNSGTQGEEYQSFRTTDNRHYWASTNSMNEKYLLSGDFVTTRKGTPAAIQAYIREGNQVSVYARGIKQLTLWFGRVYDPVTGARDMIDFAKPLRVTLNNAVPWSGNGKPLRPRMDVLLDDYCRRGDRRRLFLVRVDFDKVN